MAVTKHLLTHWLIVLAVGSTSISAANAAESYELKQSANDTRDYSVETSLKVDGHLKTSAGGGKAIGLKLNAEARLKFVERALPGAGRDAKSLRTARLYESAAATINVNDQKTRSQLNSNRRLIVVQGKREGLQLYSPAGPLNYEQLELLSTPADSLSVQGLLPVSEVEVGQTWNPASWVLQMLTATDAVSKQELTCKLESVQSGIATISFAGNIEGAIDGAASKVSINGEIEFVLAEKYITRATLTQKETRSVGTVSPGIDVTATVVTVRGLSDSPFSEFDDKTLSKIPLEPDAKQLRLQLMTPWGIVFLHDRNWHVFHQTRQVVVLRMLDRGSLIAQCNISSIPTVAAGKHTSPEQFQSDIVSALGEKLKSIESSRQVKTENGAFHYRVVVAGESEKIPMHWFYHLYADPTGRQAALVFSVESKMLERFEKQDLDLVKSIRFQSSAPRSANSKP